MESTLQSCQRAGLLPGTLTHIGGADTAYTCAGIPGARAVQSWWNWAGPQAGVASSSGNWAAKLQFLQPAEPEVTCQKWRSSSSVVPGHLITLLLAVDFVNWQTNVSEKYKLLGVCAPTAPHCWLCRTTPYIQVIKSRNVTGRAADLNQSPVVQGSPGPKAWGSGWVEARPSRR